MSDDATPACTHKLGKPGRDYCPSTLVNDKFHLLARKAEKDKVHLEDY